MEIQSDRSPIFEAASQFFSEQPQRQTLFEAKKTYIPVTVKTVDFEDLKHVLDASLDMWFTSGRYTKEFETNLPQFFGRSLKALFVNSGSSANLLAVSSLCAGGLEALGFPILKAGDEVLTAAAGFPTTVNPIFQNHLKPVFLDVDEATLNVSVETIREAITPKTRALVLAHTLGNPYRVDLIKKEFPKLLVVEDCCDALGAEIANRRVGSFGEYATCSFYPAHHITTGEGGAVMSANARLRKVAESVRDWGRDCWCDSGKDNTCQKRFEWQLGDMPFGYDHKYTYSNVGYNLKATDIQAALGISQLTKADQFISARRKNYKFLKSGLEASPILKKFYRTVSATDETNPSWFGFGLYCENGLERNQVVQFLENDRKIGTRLLFGGNLTKQPAYKKLDFRVHEELTATDKIMNLFFWIGVHPGLDEIKMNYMLESLEAATKL